MTASTFKERYRNHIKSFNHKVGGKALYFEGQKQTKFA